MLYSLEFAPPDRLITSKDHASVQIAIADVDAEGKILPTSTSFALSGQVRADGEGDDSINRLATKAGRESYLFLFIDVMPRFIIDFVAFPLSPAERMVLPKVITLLRTCCSFPVATTLQQYCNPIH